MKTTKTLWELFSSYYEKGRRLFIPGFGELKLDAKNLSIDRAFKLWETKRDILFISELGAKEYFKGKSTSELIEFINKWENLADIITIKNARVNTTMQFKKACDARIQQLDTNSSDQPVFSASGSSSN